MRILGIISFSFAMAVALYVLLLPFRACAALFGVAVIVGLIACFFSCPMGKRIRLAALGLSLGLLWCYGYEQWQLRPLGELDGQVRQIRLRVLEEVKTTAYGSQVLCRSGDVRVLAYLKDEGRGISIGDELSMNAKLSVADPGEELYYISKDIPLLAYEDSELQVQKGTFGVWDYPAKLYSILQTRIRQLFPKDTAPFMLALLTGDTEELSYGLRNDMSLAGISHVVAVSGMHVSLICALVMNLCLRRRRLAAGVCLGALWFFAAMLGFTPSVTRAVVMNSVMLMAPILRRDYDGPTGLGVALLVLLLKNPWSIASVGLQLSFAAVAGIQWMSRPIDRWLRRLCRVDHPRDYFRLRGKILHFLIGSVATTLGASVLTLPLTAYYFGTVSLISLLSNLLLLPILSAVFSLGYPLVALSFCFYPVTMWVAEQLSVVIRAVLWAVELLADIPYGALYTQSPYVILWLAASYILLALAWRYRRPGLSLALVLGMLLSVPLLQSIHREKLRFTMLDVGQGQCLLVESGEMSAVIDCGGSHGESSGEKAARALQSRGWQTVDALILTHFDTDHVGGCLQLMDRMEIRRLYLPDISEDSPWRKTLVREANQRSIPICWVTEDSQLPLDEGSVSIFAPVRKKTDNDGLSLLLSVEKCDILITGDLSHAGERELLLTRALPDLEVLVAGHHGSADSTSPQLLRYTKPELLLISVGSNPHGHPRPEVLSRAEAVGAQVQRTDQDGTIIIMR